MPVALTRPVSDAFDRCALTYRARTPIDVVKARQQHAAYEAALERAGWTVHRIPGAPDCPDAVFVEDMAVVLDEVAVITRPGAPARAGEVEGVALALAPYRPLHRIMAPARIDGGDVLRAGRVLYVGRSLRTDERGIAALHDAASPFGYRIVPVEVSGCLHLKSAATFVTAGTLLANPDWVDPAVFDAGRTIAVHPDEPHAGNAVDLGDSILVCAGNPRTQLRIDAAGVNVHALDLSELEKAEGAGTCCSLLVS